MLGMLEQAQEEGIRISFDQYPYVAGSTMLGVILPPRVHSGGTDKLLERLASPELRAKMIDDIQQGILAGITLSILPVWTKFLSPA